MTKITIEKVNPENIRADGDTQPRARIDREAYREYAERMKAGDKFRPITLFFDGKHYWLLDGFHRFAAHMIATPASPLNCEVHHGTREDAQWYSYSVNRAHGLRRTNEDKALAVKAALTHPKGVGISDRQIADHVGVHFDTVSKYRKALVREASIRKSDSRKGRDGRTINTSKIGGARGKGKRSGPRKSDGQAPRAAHKLVRGHSKPCPMIPLQLSPNNPQTAAATLFQLFSQEFCETLIQELSQRLKGTEA